MSEKKYRTNADRQCAHRKRHRNSGKQPSRRSSATKQSVTVAKPPECKRFQELPKSPDGAMVQFICSRPCPPSHRCKWCDMERRGEKFPIAAQVSFGTGKPEGL